LGELRDSQRSLQAEAVRVSERHLLEVGAKEAESKAALRAALTEQSEALQGEYGRVIQEQVQALVDLIQNQTPEGNTYGKYGEHTRKPMPHVSCLMPPSTSLVYAICTPRAFPCVSVSLCLCVYV
jgi:hypothetical protein